MAEVTYEIVEHDGGWAYKVREVFSETYPTHAEALKAAQAAAAEQELSGETEKIEYEDEEGHWHNEVAPGRDRPHTQVKAKAERTILLPPKPRIRIFAVGRQLTKETKNTRPQSHKP